MIIVGIQALPCVPPFPFVESPPLQWHPGNSQAQASPSQPMPGQHLNYQALPDVLFEGFSGQKPQNSQELTAALLEALPERYDD